MQPPLTPLRLRWEVAFPCWGSFATTAALVFLVLDAFALRDIRRLSRVVDGSAVPDRATPKVVDVGVGAEEYHVLRTAVPETPKNPSVGYRQASGVTVLGSIARARRELQMSIGIDIAAAVLVAG